MSSKDPWRVRIVGYDVKPAKDFLAHPMNFKIHLQNQQLALKGSLDELGWIDDVMVNIQTNHVINGHLRIILALREGDDTPVPVKYLDLSPEEELIALATFDPITALAVADKEKLDSLLRETKPADAALQQFLSELAAKEGITPPDFQLVSIDEQGRLDEKAKVTCPNCQFEFSLSKA